MITEPWGATAMRVHLAMVAFAGVEKHLREAHLVPEELIDSEDLDGMFADHCWLHGWGLDHQGDPVRRLS